MPRDEVSAHVGAFVEHRLCQFEQRTGGVGYHLRGQWTEVIKSEDSIECQECKLVLLIIRANNLVPLFNSDQRLLAKEFKRIVGQP